jgi:hypothetical protein
MIKKTETTKIKTGKEIVDDFFKEIDNIENVDKTMAKALSELYTNGNFTESTVVNKIRALREQNVNKN